MIAALVLSLVGAITFVEQEIPGIESAAEEPIGGAIDTGFRLAAISGGGSLDLVLPRQILPQRDGRFLTESPIPVPRHRAGAICDLWGADFYFFDAGHLTVERRAGSQWESALDQDLDAPLKSLTFGQSRQPDTLPLSVSPLRFGRFLHDVDGDGVPEIVFPMDDGIHIAAMIEKSYRTTSVLKIFPPLQYGPMPRQRLWPPETRRIAFPPRQMACRFVVQGTRVALLTKEELPERQVRYHITRYTLDPKHGFTVIPDKTSTTVTEPMDAYMQPCALRPGGAIDFGGGDWEYSKSSALPQPIFVTKATTDNGAHFQSVRAPFFRSRCSFIDMNGDGRADMIAEASDVFSGGIRECIERFTNSTTVRHELRVYLQDDQGRFAESPSWTSVFRIAMLRAPLYNDDRFRWYQSGELLDLSGDFNHDGYRDVLAHDQPGRLALYLNAGPAGGLSSKPDAVIPAESNQRFDVVDVDGDGRSDVIVRWREETQDGSVERNRVYLTREVAP